MDVKIVIIGPFFGFIMLIGIHCGTVEYRPIEKDVAKAILLNKMVHQSDNMFERRTKALVANYLVNSVISTEGDSMTSPNTDALSPDDYDYGSVFTDIDTTTTQRVFTWPPIFHNVISTTTNDYSDDIKENPIIQAILSSKVITPKMTVNSTTPTTSPTTTASSVPAPIVEVKPKPQPPRRPGGLIGAIQYVTLIVPDALRPGRNTTSLLNRQSITSILKIIGSVAFLNLTGVIDNSVTLGTSPPVRELVNGITSLVLCNPFVQAVNGGRCHRRLFEGESLNLKNLMDEL